MSGPPLHIMAASATPLSYSDVGSSGGNYRAQLGTTAFNIPRSAKCRRSLSKFSLKPSRGQQHMQQDSKVLTARFAGRLFHLHY